MSGDSESLSWVPEAVFLPGVAGNLLAVHFPAHGSCALGENVVVVPPFAEEMVRVRRMVSLLARRLSSVGVGTLVLDLFGTGDSEGDFRDAQWDIWRSDLGTAIDWLKQNCGDKVSLLGIRLGALLAMDFVQQADEIDVEKTVLWKPVVNGEDNLREFLLVRVLAGMMQKSMSRVTLESLRAKLCSGGSVESGGYEVSHTLASQIDNMRLGNLGTDRSAPIHWIDLSAPDADNPQLPGQQVIDDWNENGIVTFPYTLSGFPFWAEWEVRVVDELLDVTTEIFGNN